jgi:hypothetical protein
MVDIGEVDEIEELWTSYCEYWMSMFVDIVVCGLYGGIGAGLCFGWFYLYDTLYECMNDWMMDFEDL